MPLRLLCLNLIDGPLTQKTVLSIGWIGKNRSIFFVSSGSKLPGGLRKMNLVYLAWGISSRITTPMIRVLYTFLFSLSCIVSLANVSPVKKGQLDLRNWNPDNDPVIPLNGEWHFYWNALLLHRDLSKAQEAEYIQLSIPWNEQLVGGKQLPKNGFGTYALDIFLPGNVRSVSFAVPAVFNSYEFWVNDSLRCSSGKVGTFPETSQPRWEPQSVNVNVYSDTLHVIFRIANFQGTRGGCAEVMRIGAANYLTDLEKRFSVSGIILVIVFSIVSLGCLASFALNSHKPLLYFGLLCLAFALRFLFSDLYFYYDFLLSPPWNIAARIEYLTMPLLIITGTLFLSSIYPQDFKKFVKYFFVAVNSALALIIVFSPSSIFSQMLVILQLIGMLFTAYNVYVLVKALLSKRAGAWFTMLGLGVFSLVGFYNIYAFITLLDLDRLLIHVGYGIALILNIISLFYRTPLRLSIEKDDILRYEDLYSEHSNRM